MNYYGCDESIEYIRADDATCLPKPVRRVNNQVSTQNTPYTIKNGSQSNLYAKCNCTFYAKERRPDLPNNLGNANTWFTRASAQGFSVGYEPRVGAIGEATTGYMHVVYVESVDGDMVTISEWNFNGPCVLTYRTVHKSSFRYIY
jgi:surface antigen